MIKLLIKCGLLLLLLTACSGGQQTAVEGPIDCDPAQFGELAADVQWTPQQISQICSLWLGNLKPLPADPSNRYADDAAAVAFGHELFFDTRLSADGTIACATCHNPELNFSDGLATPVGGGPRRTQTIVGSAYSPWFFWDGHSDSQWAQALEPLESEIEHGGTRYQYAELITLDENYRQQYESIFGPLPDASTEAGATEIFVNIGKAIAAYERQIMPGEAPFDRYVQALLANDRRAMRRALDEDAEAGLALFIDEGQCINCHNGPLFTNNEFHNTAVFGSYDPGRIEGARLVQQNEFNCLGSYSDAQPDACEELNFILSDVPELEASFKTPTLRNVAEMGPYGHNGAFDNLSAILQHYNRGGIGSTLGNVGHNELSALNLDEQQLAQLEAFLHTLSGGIDAPPELLTPPQQ